MEVTCQLLGVVSEAEGGAIARAALYQRRKLRELAGKRSLGGVGEQREVVLLAYRAPGDLIHAELLGLLGSNTGALA